MKRILCYGDSNTWGFDPVTKDRLDEDTRWTRVLALTLGAGWEIIEEGLGGRTTVWEDPIEGYKNGREYLIPCLESHRPLDAVVIMLGTNDLKKRFSLSAADIAQGAGNLVGTVQTSRTGRNWTSPPVLLLAPPPTTTLTEFAEAFEGAGEKSSKFGRHYGRVAQYFGCAYLDTADIVASSPIDGIHLEAGEHRKLGEAVAQTLRKLIS